MPFKDYSVFDTITNAPWVGVEYFQQFFSDPMFWVVMKNTLGISFLKLIIGFPLGIMVAIMINELTHLRFKKTVQTISYLPHFLSWVILGGMFISWLSESGLINSLLINFNLIKEPVPFLTEPNYYWAVAVISDIWKSLGWNTILYLAAMTH